MVGHSNQLTHSMMKNSVCVSTSSFSPRHCTITNKIDHQTLFNEHDVFKDLSRHAEERAKTCTPKVGSLGIVNHSSREHDGKIAFPTSPKSLQLTCMQHKPILNIQDPCKLPGARLVDHSFVQCPVVPKPQVLKPYIRSYYVHESLEFGRARVVTKILQKGLHPCRSIANPTIKTPLTVEYVRYLKCLQQVGTKALTTETGNKCHKIGPVL